MRKRGEGVELGGDQGPLAKERGLFGYYCRGPRVPSYATADGAGLST